MLGIALYGYHQSDVLYEDLQDRYVTYVTPPPTVSQADTSHVSDGEQPTDEPAEEPLFAPISVNFDGLLQESGDVAGWLYSEGTVINYPVVRSHDNNDYLHADIRGNYLYSGSLFIDFRCSDPGTDQNHIIYGHNMKNGSMLGTLMNYKDQSYYDEHPVMYYLTPDQDYVIELFAGVVTSDDSDVYTPNFKSKEQFGAFLRGIKAQSTFVSDVPVTEDDLVVTLSTCSYEFGNARYVVLGKMTCIGG